MNPLPPSAALSTAETQGDRRSELAVHWRVLLGCYLGIAAGGASLFFYSHGVLLKSVATGFGVNRATASLAPLLGGLLFGMSAPLFGWCTERWGTARVAGIAYVVMGLGFALLGTVAGDFGAFMALICLVGLVAGATSPGVLTRPVVLAFRRQRGIALGLAVCGTGVGAVLMPMLLVRVVERYGWQGGYLALLGLLALLAPPAVWLLRHSPERPVHARTAAATPALPLEPVRWSDPLLLRLLLLFAVVSFAALGSVVHVVPLITDRGLSPREAGSYAAVLGGAIIGCRLLTGWLLDRFEAAGLSAVLFTVAAAGMLMLASGEVVLLLPGLLLLGLAVGSEHDLAAYLVGRHYPGRYALIFGVIYASTSLGASFGPMLAARVFDVTGSYQVWLWSAAGMLIVGALIAWSIRSTAQPHASAAPGSPNRSMNAS